MVPLSLFSSSSFSGTNLLTLFLYAAIGVFFFLFPLNLIQVQKYSATAAGAATLPLILLMFFLSRWSGGLVAHYGPRTPLIVGPIIAALGFTLFAVPSVGCAYWKSFFAPLVILGLGLSLTVAPLTTVVLNSAGEDRVGTASGVNNAVARVAGVLSIAILGIVMISAYGHRLDQQLVNLHLPADVLREIHEEEIKLAGLQIPSSVDSATREAIAESVNQSFVFGFRLVMLLCAGLALAGGIVAWRMVPDRKTADRR